jgi:hypothetical protein
MKDESELRLKMLDGEEKIFDRSASNLVFAEAKLSCPSFNAAFIVSSLILEKTNERVSIFRC